VTPEDLPPEVFSGKPHKVSMGLRSLDLSTWLDPDPHDPQLAQRRQLIDQRRAEVFAAVEGSERACRLVGDEVARWLGISLPGKDHPLVEAAQQVRDDICVLESRDGQWRLTAGVVCFPSHWRLADKLGHDVLSIHDPVPDYRQNLGPATVRAFDSIAAHGPRWRLNVTIVKHPELFAPHASQSDAHRPGLDSSLRVERQCLVPIADVIAFTIRTTVVSMRELSREQASAVLASAAQAPPSLAAYRGWTD
jgi:hypothetical protein